MTKDNQKQPEWFKHAINIPYEIRTVDVEDCPIEYYQWGKNDKPLLIMVHGNGGHANWWDFIAPFLTENFCVCAPHLSGMGNSGYRDSYDIVTFAKELIAVANDAGFTKNITIIGHSMGGLVTMMAAHLYPACIREIIILDSPLIFRQSNDDPEDHRPEKPTHINLKEKKYYPDFETALARFRLVPTQPCKNDFLIEHVGKHSIKKFKQGWSWKFDSGIYTNFVRQKTSFSPKELTCKFSYIYGDSSALVPEPVIPDLKNLLVNTGSVYKLEGAHHHLMLDEPEALIKLIKCILSTSIDKN